MKPDIIIDTEQAIYRITCNGEVYTRSKLKIPLIAKGMKFTGNFKLIIKPEKRLSTRINNRGYVTVRLSNKTYMVHRLVAKYYVVQHSVKQDVVNHLDGNKLNNHYSNLEWCTIQENLKHARDNGLTKASRGHKLNYKSSVTKQKAISNLKDNTSLSDAEVKFIRDNCQIRKRNSEFSLTNLAIKFGISTSAVSCIVRRKTYTHVQ